MYDKLKVIRLIISFMAIISFVSAQLTFDADNQGFVSASFDETNPWPFKTIFTTLWEPIDGNPNGHIDYQIPSTGWDDRFFAITQNSANGLGDLTGKTVYADFKRSGGTFLNQYSNTVLAYWAIGDSFDPPGNWWISKIALSIDLNSLTIETWFPQEIEMIESNWMKWANSSNTTKTFSELIADYSILGLTIMSDQVTDVNTDPWNTYVNIGGTWRLPHYGTFSNNGSTILHLDNFTVDDSLPVELSYFGVEATNDGVLASWTTESETENLGFTLDRRVAGSDAWSEIASYQTEDALLGQGSTPSATDYEYLDALVTAGSTYEYRLADVDYNNTVTYHATRTVTVASTPSGREVPDEFTVREAYPNPFNPSTTIEYSLPVIASGAPQTGQVQQSQVSLQIYDITGKLINTLIDQVQPSGWHSVQWNGKDQVGANVPAGAYLVRVKAGTDVRHTKVMLLK